ncbi:unnamed protein product [Ectocarpus sp. 12 AP-2014]
MPTGYAFLSPYLCVSSLCIRSSSVVCHHSRHALVFATSASNMVLVENNRLVEFSSRFKCTWYGLPHPVQFMVLILARKGFPRSPLPPRRRRLDGRERSKHALASRIFRMHIQRQRSRRV